MIRLSVIIPMFNVEEYLVDCLDSIFSQEIDMEVIAIDDGSTDNTLAIAERYAKRYPNMVVISQENQGVSVARNTGIHIAQGEYVTWIDSDDVYEASRLSEMLHICEVNRLDFICGSFNQFPYDFENVPERDGNLTDIMNGREFLVYSTNHGYKIQWPWQYIFSNAFLKRENILFEENIIWEGGPFAFLICNTANRAMYYNVAMINYRVHDTSLSHSRVTPKSAYNMIKSFIKMYELANRIKLNYDERNCYSLYIRSRLDFCANACYNFSNEERDELRRMLSFEEDLCYCSLVKPMIFKYEEINSTVVNLIEENTRMHEENENLKEQISLLEEKCGSDGLFYKKVKRIIKKYLNR